MCKLSFWGNYLDTWSSYSRESHCGCEGEGRVAETHAHDLPNRRDTDAENISSDLKGTLLSKVRM